MIVFDTGIHQMTFEFKLIQVTLRPSTMNQSSHFNESYKRPEIPNLKILIKHDNRPNLLKILNKYNK